MKFLLTSIIFITVFCCKAQPQKADRIFINAKIWTGDSTNAWAKAIGIKGNKILFVGDNYAQFKSGKTEIVTVDGSMIVPGFIDGHTHFLGGGFQLTNINLRNIKSKNEFISEIKKYISKQKDNHWIQGGDWDHEAWGGEMPQKEWIDSISSGWPIVLSRYDGHMVLANSTALKLANISNITPNPQGGEIERDAITGEPTGILKDEAMGLINKVVPVPTKKQLAAYLQQAEQEAFLNGVTQVNDMGSFGGWLDMATYILAHKNNMLFLRINSFVPISTWARLDSFVKKNGHGDNMLRWGGVKGFVDGSLGSTTAWLYKPYLDAPLSTGLQVTDTILLRKWILSSDSAHLMVAVHAIGDRANDWLLDTYEEANNLNGKWDRRFRIEHAQHLTQAAIARFAQMHIIPSMQPYHAIDDGKWAGKRLDSARLKRTHAYKDLLKTGAILTFGSDWTVAPLNPIAGIYAAVTRRTLDDKNPDGWFAEQKITVKQALRCYTTNNCYAIKMENSTGMLKPGMLADMVILSDNLFTGIA